MSGELQYIALPSQTGLTVEAFVYGFGILLAPNIPCPEVGGSAMYVGDMPALTGGSYIIRFHLTSGGFLQAGVINWTGTEEATLNAIYSDTSGVVSSINNDSVYMKQDGVTPIRNLLGEAPATHAYSIALYNAAKTAIIKQQYGVDELGNAALLSNATRLTDTAP